MNIARILILKRHSDDLLRYFGISASEDNKCLPSIYGLLIYIIIQPKLDLLLQLQHIL